MIKPTRKPPIEKMHLYTRCCDGLATVEELEALYEKDRPISYRTFARRVNVEQLSKLLGYTFRRGQPGVRLETDYAVHFFSSKFKGKRCYHLEWSRIDHIFLTSTDMKAGLHA